MLYDERFQSIGSKRCIDQSLRKCRRLKWICVLKMFKMIEREVWLNVVVKKIEELTKKADMIFKFSRNFHRAIREKEFRFGGKVLILSLIIFAILNLFIYYKI